VFIDGKPVEFFVDTNHFAQMNYTQSISAYSLINIPISLEDDTSEGKHDLFVVVVRGLKEEISKENHQRYFTTCIRKNLVVSNRNNIEYGLTPTGTITNISHGWTYNNAFVAVINSDTDIEGMMQRLKIKIEKSCNIPFIINAVGKPGTYSTVVFIDNMPVKAFDDQYNLVWEISENEMLEHRFVLSRDIGIGQHQVYSITIPINKTEPILQESEKFLLVVE